MREIVNSTYLLTKTNN